MARKSSRKPRKNPKKSPKKRITRQKKKTQVKKKTVATQVFNGDLNDLDARQKVSAFLQHMEEIMSSTEADNPKLLVSSHFDSDHSDMSVHSDDDMYSVSFK